MNDLSSVMMELGIVADQSRSLWALVTEHSTYALGVTKEGLVINLHWGPRLATLADLPDPCLALTHSSHDPALTSIAEEYPGFGGLRYKLMPPNRFFQDIESTEAFRRRLNGCIRKGGDHQDRDGRIPASQYSRKHGRCGSEQASSVAICPSGPSPLNVQVQVNSTMPFWNSGSLRKSSP